MKLPVLRRSTRLNRAAIDEDSRTVDLTFSSEVPVERHFGNEILDHSPKAVRLGRLQRGGPVLVDHDTRDIVGVVETVEVGGDRMGRAKVRFGRSARAEEVYQDVLDGIRTSVSVGYRVYKMERVDKESDDYRVTDWEPLEVSIVSVPADVEVGVGRADESTNQTVEIIGDDDMSDKQQDAAPAPAKPEVDVREIQSQARKEEQQRIRSIAAMGEKFGCKDLARKFIDEGKSVESFREAYIETLPGVEKIERPDPEIGMTDKERSNYSFLRLLRHLTFPQDRRFAEEAAFEIECSEAVRKDDHVRKDAHATIPYDVLIHQRDLTATGSTTGDEFVETELRAGSFIELLRNNMVLQRLGITNLTGLQGDVAIPRQNGSATTYWLATETTAITESTQTTGQVSLTPKHVGAFTDYSRQFMLQSSIDAENFVRNDLAQVLAIGIDLAGIYGSGVAGQPVGIGSTSGIGSVSFAATNPTWAEIVEMEETVETANALMGNLAYLTHPSGRSSAKTTEKASNTAQFIWQGDNTVNGYRALSSTQVTSGDWWFANWRDLLLGMWGGLDILVDPYSNSTSRLTRIVAVQTCDFAVRHAASFVRGNSGSTP